MMNYRRGTQFLQRLGITPSYRQPNPKMEAARWKIHALPLELPLPLPETTRMYDGDPAGDRVEVTPWPPTDVS